MPKEITERYYVERNEQDYEINLPSAQMAQDALSMGKQRTSQFLVTEAAGRNTGIAGGSIGDVVNENELLGNIVGNLPLVKIRYDDNYSEEVPKIFYLLTTFF